MSNTFLYFEPFLLSIALSFLLTKALVVIGNRYKLYGKEEKNNKNVPRFGGVAIIFSFLLAIFLNGNLVFDRLKWGMFASSLVILFLGIYDDLKNLSWKRQFIMQIAVALVMIFAGLSVDYIANPFGGAEFRLDQIQYPIFNIQFSILGSIFIALWIIGFMNAMNWLDGLDGLAGGVGFIGAVTLFFLSISDKVNQPPLGIISVITAGAILGFLFYNFHPAKIMMGTSGSMFLGFMLAIIAIFSGGKIATALLVMGLPIFDAIYVIAQRTKAGKSPFRGDTLHLHYKLLQAGWSERQVALFMYFVSAFFGMLAVTFQSMGKVLALAILFLLAMAIFFIVEAKKEKKSP